jgi:hypothetical protein
MDNCGKSRANTCLEYPDFGRGAFIRLNPMPSGFGES